nr:hypothetical protein [uncultured Cetobacterium sp.]
MFLSPGEKLLKYRKKYELTQEELVQGKVSKVYLGMVEKNKKKLSKKTGLIIYLNLEYLLKEKGFTLDLSYEEFIKESKDQILQYIDDIKFERKSLDEKYIWNINEHLMNFSYKEKIEIIKKLIEIYTKFGEKDELRKIYLKFFQLEKNIKGKEKELVDFFKLSTGKKEYKDIFIIFSKYFDEIYNIKLGNNSESMIYYYVNSVYHLEKEIVEIEKINKLIFKLKSKELRSKILILIGKIYLKNKSYESAEKIYEDLLKKSGDNKDKTNIILELLKFFREIDAKEKTRNYYLKLKKLDKKNEHIDKQIKFELLYELGKTAQYLKNKKEAKDYYIEALIIGKGIDVSLENVMNIILQLFTIFEKNDYYSLLSIEKEYLRILENYKDYRPVIKLIEYYYKNHPSKLGEKFIIFNNYLE